MAEYYKDTKKYEKYYELQYPFDDSRPRMPLHDRAAQFAPFKELEGHEEAIEETGRLTEKQIVLDESMVEQINEKLCYIAENLEKQLQVAITYFKTDERKSGGAYLTDISAVKKIDEVERLIYLTNGIVLKMEQVVTIEYIENQTRE